MKIASLNVNIFTTKACKHASVYMRSFLMYPISMVNLKVWLINYLYCQEMADWTNEGADILQRQT